MLYDVLEHDTMLFISTYLLNQYMFPDNKYIMVLDVLLHTSYVHPILQATPPCTQRRWEHCNARGKMTRKIYK